MSTPYQPSNANDGDLFTTRYCMQCKKCNPNPSAEPQCSILARALGYDIDDPEYPKEWVYNEDATPICTAHEFWNWETGTPKPKEFIPENQLKMF